MKKESYEIRVANGSNKWKYEKVNGLVEKMFGVHRLGEKKSEYSWVVTHIATGLKAVTFDFQWQARELIKWLETETFPVPWNADVDYKEFRKNASIVLDKIQQIRYM